MKIHIAGDSWGVGEWVREEHDCRGRSDNVSHRGLEYFLTQQGHTVFNYSAGGLSNIRSAETLSIRPQADYVFWFQTDPMRDFYLDAKKWSFTTYDTLIDASDELLGAAYKSLNDIGVKIYCIGGLSKLNLELLAKYPNLVPLIPSVMEFLVPGFAAPAVIYSKWTRWFDSRKHLFSVNDLDRITLEMVKITGLRKDYPELFWPDGVHPNREGHRLLFNHICKELSL
jgi:lysophospholipase L1-like esterase